MVNNTWLIIKQNDFNQLVVWLDVAYYVPDINRFLIIKVKTIKKKIKQETKEQKKIYKKTGQMFTFL